MTWIPLYAISVKGKQYLTNAVLFYPTPISKWEEGRGVSFNLHISNARSLFRLSDAGETSTVDETDLVELFDRSWKTEIDIEPSIIIRARNTLQETTTLANATKDDPVNGPLNSRIRDEAFNALFFLIEKWRKDCITLKERKKNELRQKYFMSCYGEPEIVRRFLFQLSSALVSDDFHEISLAYNSYNGLF